MTKRFRMRAVIVVVAGLVLVVGCTPGGSPTSSPTVSESTTAPTESPTPTPGPTPSASPAPSPSPSPSPTVVESFPVAPATESGEQAAVREGWRRYESVLDKFYKDAGLTDYSETQHVTTGDESIRAVFAIRQHRERRLQRSGDVMYRDVAIRMGSEAGPATAQVRYCLDMSRVTSTNLETGESRTPSQTALVTVTMEKMPDGSWRAAHYANELARC